MDDYFSLIESMKIIQSQEQLLNFEVSMLPNMKDKSRSKTINSHQKIAETLKEKKVFTTDQLFKLIG